MFPLVSLIFLTARCSFHCPLFTSYCSLFSFHCSHYSRASHFHSLFTLSIVSIIVTYFSHCCSLPQLSLPLTHISLTKKRRVGQESTLIDRENQFLGYAPIHALNFLCIHLRLYPMKDRERDHCTLCMSLRHVLDIESNE